MFNNTKMIVLYSLASFSIFAWFFLMSVEVNVQTDIKGSEISVRKKNKLSKRFYYKINKISFEDPNNPQSPAVVDVRLLREEREGYIYGLSYPSHIPDYKRSTVRARIYQIF